MSGNGNRQNTRKLKKTKKKQSTDYKSEKKFGLKRAKVAQDFSATASECSHLTTPFHGTASLSRTELQLTKMRRQLDNKSQEENSVCSCEAHVSRTDY